MSIGFKACADLFISDGSGFLYLYYDYQKTS